MDSYADAFVRASNDQSGPYMYIRLRSICTRTRGSVEVLGPQGHRRGGLSCIERLCFNPCRQQELAPPSEEGPKLSVESVKGSLSKSVEAWQLYRSQAVFPAALALALLYLTVMNFVSLLYHLQLMSLGMLADILGRQESAFLILLLLSSASL